MKNLWIIVFGVFLLMSSSACQKESIEYTYGDDDYVIFGKYYGECMGDCVHLYRLTRTKIFMDDQDWGIPDEIPFFSTPLEQDKGC